MVYDCCEFFVDSLVWVVKMVDGKLCYGLIDQKGMVIILFFYDVVGSYLNMDDYYKV